MSPRYPLATVAMPEEDVEAVLACLGEGWLTMGPRTQSFEAELAQLSGAEHAVCVSSGTAALHLSLLAAGIGSGDEVVVPSMSSVATAAAVRHCGARPVFCDVASPREPTLDPGQLEQLVTERTRAVVAVHLLGYPPSIEALGTLCRERGLTLIEDAAEAMGARSEMDGRMAGTAGDAGCLSFASTSQLPVGEGGAVLTDDEGLAAQVRSRRSHAMTSGTWDRHRGYSQSYDVVDVGFNFRIDEPRAALGLSRLPRLAGEVEERRRVVRGYRELLDGVRGVELPWNAGTLEGASPYAFVLLAADRATRDRARERLAADGIETGCLPAVHTLSEYRGAGAELPRTEEFAARHLRLPLSPALADDDLRVICEAAREALAG